MGGAQERVGSCGTGSKQLMIDTHERHEVNPTNEPTRRNSGLLVAGFAGLIGAVLIVLGISGLGQPASTASNTPLASAILEVTSPDVDESASTIAADERDPTGTSGIVLTDISDVVGRLADSVVAIESIGQLRGRQLVLGSGSGVVVAEGTIITNAHVVEAATAVVVTLNDGSEHSGTIVTIDIETDLAVIGVEGDDLQPVETGSTSDLEVGDGVFAIGYPLGLEGSPSVSTGIVSALDRNLEEGDVSLFGLVQTDAAITEGSSGGGLFDASGHLIGVTTAVGVSSVGIEGIGFAIPVETIVAQLQSLGESSADSP